MVTNHPTLGAHLAAATDPAQSLCVGIDPHSESLKNWGLGDDADGAKRFGMDIIAGSREAGVRILKPQVALFERLGLRGLSVLSELIHSARAEGMWVIADGKRGDIGTTMEGYASAWLDAGSDFESDGLTLHPYLGVDTLEPAFERAQSLGKSVFVLAATSNPEAGSVQSTIDTHGHSLAQSILRQLQARYERSGETSRWLGAVVGATVSPIERGLDLTECPGISLLAPGFGHQGASLESVRSIFGTAYQRVIPAVSRSVAGASPEGLVDRIRAHLGEASRGSL